MKKIILGLAVITATIVSCKKANYKNVESVTDSTVVTKDTQVVKTDSVVLVTDTIKK